MRTRGPDDADGSVVDGKLFILLERLSQRMQTMSDEVF
jgi:hypothetical protein